MRLNVYAVYDKAVNAYLQPFYARTAGEAIRSFTELANDRNTNVGRHPLDYVLMYMGEYDDNTGQFVQDDKGPMRLLAANEVAVNPIFDPIPLNGKGLNENEQAS